MVEKPGNFLAGLLIGMIAGSAITLLIAPMSGQETRSLIGNKASEIGNKAGDKIGSVVDQAGKSINRIQDKGGQILANQKDRVGKIIRRSGEEIEASQI